MGLLGRWNWLWEKYMRVRVWRLKPPDSWRAVPLYLIAWIFELLFAVVKIVFLEQRATGTLQVWREPLTELRIPLIFNLRTDPYERANLTSNTYEDWFIDHAYMMGPAQMFVAKMAQSLAEFPRRQEPASFTIDKVIAKIQQGIGSS